MDFISTELTNKKYTRVIKSGKQWKVQLLPKCIEQRLVRAEAREVSKYLDDKIKIALTEIEDAEVDE